MIKSEGASDSRRVKKATGLLPGIPPAIIIQTPIMENLRFTNSTYYVGKNGKIKWSVSNERIAAGAVGTIGLIGIAALIILSSS